MTSLGATPAAAQVITAEEVEQAPTLPDAGLQALLRFWGFERLVIDHNVLPVPQVPRLQSQVIAKAYPDECFNGVGQPYPPITYVDGKAVCYPGQPKTNESYIWGMAESNGYLYFGTLANTHCLVEQGYLDMTEPNLNPYWVCEFGQAKSGRGDNRVPRLYRYKVGYGPVEPLYVPSPNPTDPADPGYLLKTTGGIRSAGSLNGVVLFAGAGGGGVNFFAFDGETGHFLAAKKLPYSDIRQWEEFKGQLYTAVGASVTACGARGGAVLKWVGKKSYVTDEVLKFEEVGDLDAPGAYIVGLGDRLWISSWPSSGKSGCLDAYGKPVSDFRYAGIIRGPVVPEGGLTYEHKSQWKKIWSFDQYDPDMVAAMSYGGGALRGFQGALFFGTMHVPLSAANRAGKMLNLDADGSGAVEAAESLNTAIGTHRAISIFRMLDPEAEYPEVDLLYGELYLPKYDYLLRKYTLAYDAEHMNKMGKKPLFGASGFGSFWNNYTWIMNVYEGDLYVGTMDWSQLARVSIMNALAPESVSFEPQESATLTRLLGPNGLVEGADLFRFNWKYGRARAESINGLNNFTNYGFRTVVNTAGKMYIGSANPMNLHPHGGWELIELEPRDPENCEGFADGIWCNDGDRCTEDDECKGGECVGEPVELAAAEACRYPVCHERTGLAMVDVEDGTACAGGTCLAGVCIPTQPQEPEDPPCDHHDSDQQPPPNVVTPGDHSTGGTGSTPEPQIPEPDHHSSRSGCGCGAGGQGGAGIVAAILFGMLAVARRRREGVAV